MATSTSHWELEGELTLQAPAGTPLTASGVDFAIDREDGALVEARLTLDVSPEVYRRIEREGLFHLDADARGPGAGRFEPDSDVRIEARLDRSLLPGVAVLGTDITEIGPRFASAAGSPLHQTESWYALHVTVEVLRDAEGGSLREGYSTQYATGAELELPMLAIAAGALEERGLDWSNTSDPEVLQAEVAGDHGSWACYVVARAREHRCTVYSQLPWEVLPELRPAMAELLTRINFGLPLGNFEMDFSDGEVRFKTSVDVSGGRLTPQLFESLLEPNFATVDVYLPALDGVREGRLDPAAAVEMVES